MRTLAALLLALVLLALPAGAFAQGGNPFGPPTPPGPQAPPELPKPPEPPAAPKEDDGALSTPEAIFLGGLTVLLIGGAFVAVVRGGGGSGAPKRRERRKRRGTRPKQPESKHAVSRSGTPAGDGRPARKAPPPPPRKRRSKSKKR